MKILIDINHPAHVHFFRPIAEKLIEKGHYVLFTASQKDITFELLADLNIPYENLGSYGTVFIKKILSIPLLNWRFLKVVHRFKPDIVTGIASFRAAQIGFLTNTPSAIFDDTEHATKILYKYFASKIFSPSCFYLDLGKKHLKYNGYHELSYLNKDYFIPNINIVTKAGFDLDKPLFIVRFVSWDAVHDFNEKGLSFDGKKRLISMLLKRGVVALSCEGEIPEEFEQYTIRFSPKEIHHFLYYAHMYVGEGGTMASEAAVLGTPSLFISSLYLGCLDELEKKYDLMYSFSDESLLFDKINLLINDSKLKEEWKIKREKLLLDKIDVCSWAVNQLLALVK